MDLQVQPRCFRISPHATGSVAVEPKPTGNTLIKTSDMLYNRRHTVGSEMKVNPAFYL